MTALSPNRDCRAACYALASCILGVILMRIAVYLIPLGGDTYGDSLLHSALFTLPVQLVFFLAVPFLIFKLYGKRTVKQTLEFSSIGRFKPYFLLALPIGVAVYFITIAVSSAWSGFLSLTGYVYSSSSTPKPDTFVAWYFIADVLLTAVLPAVCEEFAMRGGLLTTARHSLGKMGCVVLCGVAFGLFHQNVRQVFYTALFGALAAFMTMETRSIFPAMIMHFTNNFCSVFFDYAAQYKFAVFGGMFDAINSAPVWAVAVVFLLIALGGAALVALMLYVRDKTAAKTDAAGAAQNALSVGLFDVNGETAMFKPTLRDVAVGVAIGVVALLTTVFSYVWGFFY